MKIFIVLFVILLTLLCIGTLFAESYFWVDSQIAPKWCSFYVFGGFLIFLYELVLYKYGNCTTSVSYTHLIWVSIQTAPLKLPNFLISVVKKSYVQNYGI